MNQRLKEELTVLIERLEGALYKFKERNEKVRVGHQMGMGVDL
jgi:hypothetical protein